MKQSINLRFKSFLLLLTVFFFQTILIAQDSTGTTTKITTSSTKTTEWYMQPWAWAVGAAVFILLIIALVRGNSSNASSTDRVTVTKTVRREVE